MAQGAAAWRSADVPERPWIAQGCGAQRPPCPPRPLLPTRAQALRRSRPSPVGEAWGSRPGLQRDSPPPTRLRNLPTGRSPSCRGPLQPWLGPGLGVQSPGVPPPTHLPAPSAPQAPACHRSAGLSGEAGGKVWGPHFQECSPPFRGPQGVPSAFLNAQYPGEGQAPSPGLTEPLLPHQEVRKAGVLPCVDPTGNDRLLLIPMCDSKAPSLL